MNAEKSNSDDVVMVDWPEPGIGVLTFNRPHRKNAMSPSCIPHLVDAVNTLAADREVRVVIVTGAGGAFCTGMDLSRLDEMAPREVEPTVAWMQQLHAFSVALASIPQPTIAAVPGPAIGGGLGMALGCDLRIASPTARFGATFAKMALGPDAGVSKTLARIVGEAKALDMLLTGELIGSEEALRLGLVTQIADDALGEALAIARRWSEVPGYASQQIKRAMRLSADADIQTTLMEIEPQTQAELICHPDFFTNAADWLSGHSG
ncbi:enoyl-CoA hydratase/isomerase family protein [Gordonia sp. (in: high G+C Gram-positive bacteria)]|uniref:enoyl-CoA hydratase/isomerase family protein n=1 Tax=Gordonia sp. (in: high G+C Gram-positive bacteria) TaxID=84139 RepID=UPI003C747644